MKKGNCYKDRLSEPDHFIFERGYSIITDREFIKTLVGQFLSARILFYIYFFLLLMILQYHINTIIKYYY